MGNLETHARRELKAAGLFSEDSDYGGMLGDATMRLIKMFAAEGHSGCSASMAVQLFEKLARYEPLGPLTGEDSEWTLVGHAPEMAAQNKRCSHVFKRSDGTAYDSEGRIFREPNGSCYTGNGSCVDITFPYTPKHEYVDVNNSEDSSDA